LPCCSAWAVSRPPRIQIPVGSSAASGADSPAANIMMMPAVAPHETNGLAMLPQPVRGAARWHPGYYRRQASQARRTLCRIQLAEAHMQIASFMKDDVREMFDRIDADGDRRIDFEEFAGLMLEIDHSRPHSELRARFDFIDTDHDGRVSFDEFCQWVTR
jgi:hypothetical protein